MAKKPASTPPEPPKRFVVVNGVTYHHLDELEVIVPELGTIRAQLTLSLTPDVGHLGMRSMEYVQGCYVYLSYTTYGSEVQALFVLLYDGTHTDKRRRAGLPSQYYYDATIEGHTITATILRRTDLTDTQRRFCRPADKPEPIAPDPEPVPDIKPIPTPKPGAQLSLF